MQWNCTGNTALIATSKTNHIMGPDEIRRFVALRKRGESATYGFVIPYWDPIRPFSRIFLFNSA